MSHPHVSPQVWEHFQHPRNAGQLHDCSGEGNAGSLESQRFMRIQVCLDSRRERIVEARFGTYGCVPAIACGSYITEWVRGRTTVEAVTITPAELRKSLGGLPVGRRYCADLAVEALCSAVSDALERTQHGRVS